MGIKRTVSIRQIDLWGSEPLESKKIKQNWQKTEMSIFPLYFWANPFVILKVVATLKTKSFPKKLCFFLKFFTF